MIEHRFSNSQKAWEELNAFFLNKEEFITRQGGGRYGGQLVSYDHFIIIDRAWVKPSFDFGNMFGYRAQKWTGLLNNYVDPEELETLKEAVLERENKKSKHYNISMPFHNKHGHGKGCLLSITLTRRQNIKTPIATVTMRSSEITKRLLLDLLLVQRICEFIYSTNKVQINLYATNIYQNAEAFTMFDSHINIVDIMQIYGDYSNWQRKILSVLNKFKTCDIEEIKMKVHKRCVRQLQRPNGYPLSGDRPMLAKDLKLKL